jgi:UDP-N-acetylglucosamine 4,6-dehydratase/5-epimerase
MSSEKSILITGGTGSFGKKFVQTLLEKDPQIKRLVIFSRDELKQFEMEQHFPRQKYPGIRYFLGDVRDRDRLRRALEGIDTVVHAAALKQVPAAEYNPMEFIKTNVLGAENMIEACMDTGVQRVVALSTDKACAPINLYGATKLCSDKLFIAANNTRGSHNIRFSVVRYGNVMGSRGSVIPFFLGRKNSGVLPITDPEMTRFNITLEEGVEMVLHSIDHAHGGELFVRKSPSYRITTLAEAIGPECKHPVIGIRPGEKVHEQMITESDSFCTVDLGRYFAVLPQGREKLLENYLSQPGVTKVSQGFCYESGTNTEWLDVPTLRKLIRAHCDSQFDLT